MNFNLQKFSTDIKNFRKTSGLTQSELASKLELDNHTLISFFEQGKRAPSKSVFANYCRLTNHTSEEYWENDEPLPNVFLMGKFSDSDKASFTEALEKIQMREYLFALYERVSAK